MAIAPSRGPFLTVKHGMAQRAGIHRGQHRVLGRGRHGIAGQCWHGFPASALRVTICYVPISVLIGDDHAAFRARAREMLGSASNHVVAWAADRASWIGAVTKFDLTARSLDGPIGRAP